MDENLFVWSAFTRACQQQEVSASRRYLDESRGQERGDHDFGDEACRLTGSGEGTLSDSLCIGVLLSHQSVWVAVDMPRSRGYILMKQEMELQKVCVVYKQLLVFARYGEKRKPNVSQAC